MSIEFTSDELTRVMCAVQNHRDVSSWYEGLPRCYTPCGWVGLLETSPDGSPRKEQFAAHWQEQVANELAPIVAAQVAEALRAMTEVTVCGCVECRFWRKTLEQYAAEFDPAPGNDDGEGR